MSLCVKGLHEMTSDNTLVDGARCRQCKRERDRRSKKLRRNGFVGSRVPATPQDGGYPGGPRALAKELGLKPFGNSNAWSYDLLEDAAARDYWINRSAS